MALTLVAFPSVAEPALGRTPQTLDEALNVPGNNIHFVSDGEYPWVIDGENDWATTTNQGINSTSCQVTADIVAQEGDVVMFDYKVSSETRYDKLIFAIDGEPMASAPWTLWSGEIDWTYAAYTLTAGEHQLSWTYSKDDSAGGFADSAWLDNVYVGAPIAPESVEINEAETVAAGRKIQLTWNVLPQNAFNKAVTFSSSDESIASVDANGLVTGVSVGNAIITVTTVDGNVTDTCAINVVEGTPPVNLYGYMGDSWISFTEVEPNLTSELNITGVEMTAGEFAGGKVYGYAGQRYFILDFETMTVELLGETISNATVRDMAYDHSTQTMYALGTNSNLDRYLYTVNLTTGGLSEVAPVSCGSSTVMTLAISTEGDAYCLTESYSNNSCLYSLNLNTGVGTLIGSTGFGLKRYQSMAYDHNTNQLFWGRFSDYGVTGLSIINTQTAYTEDCGQIGATGGQIYGLFIPNDLEINTPSDEDFTVRFIDGVTNAVIDTVEVTPGTVFTTRDFPYIPKHDGYSFIDWNYNGTAIIADTDIVAEYFDLSSASITLIVQDEVYYDGSGFQMLIDADANEYGNGISIGGEPFAYGQGGAVDLYTRFEYKVPNDADGDFLTDDDIVYCGESVTISVPAGVYDWCIVNPRYWDDDGAVIDFVYDIGNANGRNDNYAFEAGKSYTFTVYRYGELAAVDVSVVDYNHISGDVNGNGFTDMTDALLVLRYSMAVSELTSPQLAVADVDATLGVDVSDALHIVRSVLGLTETAVNIAKAEF